jgi:uncharacterized repeat protein (TIGR03803 family)
MRKTSVSEWLFLVPLSLGQTHRWIRSSLKMRWCVNPISASLLLAAFLFTATPGCATDTLTVIHDFAGGNGGSEPNWLIQASDGNFYGTTYLGVGTVFQVTPAGQFKTVFDLPPQNPNRFFYGDYFTSVVEGFDGFLYVTARGSNNNPNPMLFRISKSGKDYQVVLQEAPAALSVGSDGNFYGSDGSGIFRLSTGGAYTLLTSQSGSGFTVSSLSKQTTDGNFYGNCYLVPRVPGVHLRAGNPDLRVPHRHQWANSRERVFDTRLGWLPVRCCARRPERYHPSGYFSAQHIGQLP